jgi:hypothetical protein
MSASLSLHICTSTPVYISLCAHCICVHLSSVDLVSLQNQHRLRFKASGVTGPVLEGSSQETPPTLGSSDRDGLVRPGGGRGPGGSQEQSPGVEGQRVTKPGFLLKCHRVSRADQTQRCHETQFSPPRALYLKVFHVTVTMLKSLSAPCGETQATGPRM